MPRSMTRSGAAASVASVALSVLLFANASHALEASACVAAADSAQRLRLAGKLLSAQDALVTCADPSCPGVVRVACSEWLTDVKKSIPTVVFAARETTHSCTASGDRTETHDLLDVDVKVDGKLL